MKKSFSVIAKKYRLKLVVLFGSVAKNRGNKLSDIDLAVILDAPLSIKRELILRKELFEFFRREVDLVFIKRASPLVLQQIARFGELLHGSQKDFNEFRIYAIKRYIDFEPYFKLRESFIDRKIANFYA